MLNHEIRARAKEMIKANIAVFCMAGILYYLIDYMAGSNNNMVVGTVMAFVKAVASASAASFYIRAFNKGVPDTRDMYDVFTYPQSQNKFLSILMLLAILNIISRFVTALFLFIPVLNVISVFVIAIIGYLLNLIWYLYVTNPDYPTEYYVKASIRYMSDGCIGYLIFILGTAILPAVIVAVASIFSSILGSFCQIFMNIYMALATAGYVERNMIPSEWYYGGARF